MNEQTDRLAARIALVEEHIRCENEHDLDGVLQTFGDTPSYEDEPWSDFRKGRDQVRAYYRELLHATPDLHIEVQRRHATCEAVILEVEIRGTHLGPWRGLPPTGRRVRFPLCAVYTFDDQNKLSGEKVYYDRATVLRQLGMFHEPNGIPGVLLTPLSHPLTIGRSLGRMVLGKFRMF